MEILQDQNFLEFAARFKIDVNTFYSLTSVKTSESYSSNLRVYIKTQIRKKLLRICNFCKSIKSSIVDTLFYHVRFRLLKIFYICCKMADSTKINQSQPKQINRNVKAQKITILNLVNN